jgi:hypothetical protein
LSAKHADNPRLSVAVEDLKGVIRSRYPEASFHTAHAPDEPEIVLLFATVDAPDLDEVLSLVLDRVLQYQLDEKLPIHVIPLLGPLAIADALGRAINELRVVEFVDGEGHRRTVEPHAIFWTPRGTRCLHCYQLQGYTKAGGLPQWRNPPLSNMREVELTDRKFKPRPDFNPSNQAIFDRIDVQVPANSAA